MKIITKIIQDDIVKLQKDTCIEPENAITLARDNGISGRIEVQHFITVNNEEIRYAVYVIDSINQIISAVYPHGKLNIHSLQV